MSRQSQLKYREAGLCILCGAKPPRKSRQTCDECAIRTSNYTKKMRSARIDGGKCCVCGKNELFTKRHCTDCYEKHKQSAKKQYDELKDEVYVAYGGYRCVCCGETEAVFLSIDHIDQNGETHRKEIGSRIYRWLKTNNFPYGFQVLCMNCQWGRMRCNGVCPHQNK